MGWYLVYQTLNIIFCVVNPHRIPTQPYVIYILAYLSLFPLGSSGQAAYMETHHEYIW
jgi:hypothetical protein